MSMGKRMALLLAVISVAGVLASGVALAVTSSGTEGNDVLDGTPENDIIAGRGGNDTMSGFGGSDRVDGEDGDDVLFGAYEVDDQVVQDGNDLILGGAGNDTISGDPGADEVRGGPGNDTITAGPDASVDTVYGQDGADTIDVADDPASKDLAYCGAGTDDAVVADRLDVVADDCETVDKLLSDGQALVRDARVYASDYGVTVDEALRRLDLQDDIGVLQDKLAANEGATYGGLELRHSPEFEVVGYFTEGGARTIQPYVQNTRLEGMTRTTQVGATLAELETAQAQAISDAEAAGVPVESDINVRANRVEMYVTAENLEQLDTATRSSTTSYVDTVTVAALSEPAAFYGGTHLSTCTTGFVVRRDNGSEGMVTAGHCIPNPPNYEGTQYWRGGRTVFVVQAVRDSYDVQYHYTPNVEDKARFYTGVGVNSVRAVRGRNHQFIGRIICKYGKNAGFKCAKIVGRTYKIMSFGTSMNSTFMRARRTGGGLVASGDSGGPVFDGSTALGTISALRRDGDMIYMAINYVNAAPIGVAKVQTVR